MSLELLGLLSFLISSGLTFLSVAFAMEGMFFLFQVRNFRVRSLLRLVPFAALLIDTQIGNWFNPLSCESCVQKLLLGAFFPDLQAYLNENEMSLIRYLSFEGISFWTTLLMGAFYLVSFVLVARKVYQIVFWMRKLNQIKERASSHTVLNRTVWMSEEIRVPMASFKWILLPKKMEMEPDEWEAVVAHEAEHLKWKDPLTNLFAHLAATVFWWVPTGFWLKKMEEEQELAADRAIHQYGLQGESLASAFIKVAKAKASGHRLAFCPFVVQKSATFTRLNAILGLKEPKHWITPALVGAGIGASIALLCLAV